MDFATEMADRKAIRKVLTRPFSSTRVAALRPLAQAVAADLLDAIAADTTSAGDLSTFAAQLPRRVTSAHLGIPPGGVEEFTPSAKVLTASSLGGAEQDSTAAMGSLARTG